MKKLSLIYYLFGHFKLTAFSSLNRLFACSCALLILISSEARIWTNKEGQQVEAQLVKIQQDSIKIRVSSSNRIYDYKTSDLSQQDLDYIADIKGKQMAEEASKHAGALIVNRKVKFHADYETAIAEAAELQLPLLIILTRSDACSNCGAFDKDVARTSGFKHFAKANLVLFSINTDSADEEVLDKLYELYGKTEIYPNFTLIESTGERINSWAVYARKFL